MKEKHIGYVLNSIDYKDSDSLVSVLCKEGLILIRAKGIKKVNSKNASSVMNYAYSEFEVNRSSKTDYLTLCEGKLLDYPLFISSDLEYISVISFISEGIEKIEDNSDCFELFTKCITCMKEKKNSEFILIAFINYFLKKQGCELNVDECINCGKKENIIKFSFQKGGYLCKDCHNGERDNIDYLKNMRILSKINYSNIDKVSVRSIYSFRYIKEIISLIESQIGIYFKSKLFLLRILKKEEF